MLFHKGCFGFLLVHAWLFSTALQIAASELQTRVSPWCTDALAWTTPNNVTILYFDKEHPLPVPLPYSMMLRVHDSEACAAVDSDPNVGMWWAEVRRHVPDENALAIGSIAAKHLPTGVNARKDLGLTDGCSRIALLSHGSDLKTRSTVNVAPLDGDGIKAHIAWHAGAYRTHCEVENQAGRPVTLYWVDDQLDERELLTMQPGETVPQQTFMGHIFVARETDGEKKAVDWWAMSGAPVHVVEDKASSIAQGSCQAPVVGSATGNAAAERLGSGAAGAAASIRDDALLGSSMRAGAGSFTKCTNHNDDGDAAASPSSFGASPEQAAFDYLYDSSVAKRYALNTVQPTIVHNYSDVGYALMPLPAPTFKWLKAWYEGHAHEEIKESSAGAVGTQHKAPWYVRHIHYPLKTKLIRELLPLLAEWSGYRAEALQMTSIYGIRRYSRGSVLRMHVDTTVTHVVSAIVNVAQDGMEKDWPLEIKGNDGLYHYVNMKPGEMLLYESAKCLHGRPQPLEGEGYSNIFLHFQPTDPGDWEYNWY